tara:strand:- start:1420 stop:1629 length:210 start_codon:yes stop_codon:yes gene_type:complete
MGETSEEFWVGLIEKYPWIDGEMSESAEGFLNVVKNAIFFAANEGYRLGYDAGKVDEGAVALQKELEEK